MHERYSYNLNGDILVIKNDCNNWRQCITTYETNNPLENKVKFIIYPNSNNAWSIRALSEQQFKNRVDLLPLEILKSKMNKPEELTFVHAKLFIASALTIETCIEVICSSKKT